MHRLTRAAAAALLLASLAAPPAIAADRTVTMRDNRYAPATVTIRPGDTVTWTNDGQLPHDASGDGWATPLLDPGQSDGVTFTRTGTYRYACTIHAEMRGTVRVVAAGATIPPTHTAATGVGEVMSTGSAGPVILVPIVAGLLAVWATRRRYRPTA